MNVDPWIGVIGILITVAGSYGAARYAGKSSVKVKELDVDGQAYIRAEGITQGLIETLRKQIEDLQLDRASDLARIEKIELEVREVRTHNNALIAYCYRLIEILRRHGHGDEIPTPPPTGIHL
jgi:hypothetical protein